jgi:hypothetical protein
LARSEEFVPKELVRETVLARGAASDLKTAREIDSIGSTAAELTKESNTATLLVAARRRGETKIEAARQHPPGDAGA